MKFSPAKLIPPAMVLAFFVIGTGSARTRNDLEKSLEEAYSAMNDAWIHGRLEKIEEYLAPDFRLTDFGMDLRREAYLRELGSSRPEGGYSLRRIEIIDHRLQSDQVISTVRIEALEKRHPDGPTTQYVERIALDRWRRIGGKLQLENRRIKRTAGGMVSPSLPPVPVLSSPRLARLREEMKTDDKSPLESFWKSLSGKAPLVEPVRDDPSHYWVTFLWRGKEGDERVCLSGGLPAAENPKPLQRLPESDIWFRTEKIPSDARFAYSIGAIRRIPLPPSEIRAGLDPEVMLMGPDPLNPRTFGSGSLVELPGAPVQDWIQPSPGGASGRMIDFTLSSRILGEDRDVTVYRPVVEGGGGELDLVVLFDGNADGMPIPLQVVFDNLIRRRAVPPVLGVFVHNINGDRRRRDLGCSQPFADFIALELVPWAGRKFSVTSKSGRRVIGGLSLGGLMAAFTAMRHPEVFGKVLSQSGSFWYYPERRNSPPLHEVETGWLARRFADLPRLPLDFYMEVGRFEKYFDISMPDENRRFRDVLRSKGYSVVYREYNGGHDYVTWRQSLAEGLAVLLGKTDAGGIRRRHSEEPEGRT